MNLARELIQLGEQLAAENNAAHDLWTWLPSYRVAQKHHRDASEHRPRNRDVMVEAAMYLSTMNRADTPLTPEEQEWFTRCSCGEDHEGG